MSSIGVIQPKGDTLHGSVPSRKSITGKVYVSSISSSMAWLTEVTLLASAWEGSDRLWHQVVTIEGTTKYSQVDLTPSAEQLKIFHEKDVAFTTENEDGTVTVFAIGDKPSNDYTIQATIIEVRL